MLFKFLFTILLIGLFTTNIASRVISLTPGESHVIHRKSRKEAQDTNNLESTRERRNANITSELIHTITTLEGDSHNYAVIHWSGLKRSNVVFILTFEISETADYEIGESTLWRSDDYGKTFSVQTSNFYSDAVIDYFAIPDTDHTNLVLGDSTHGVIYVTRDEGASYTNVTAQGFYWFDFYPGSDTVLAGYNKNEQSIWGSNDGGLTWYKLSDGVETYQFRDQVTNSMYIITDDKKLYTITISPTSQKTEFDSNLGLVIESSLRKSGDYLFVQKQASNNAVELWVSHMGSPFRKALFPSATYVTHQVYYIVSVHNRQLLVLVSSSPDDSLGDLFLSDETGTLYSLSLTQVLTYTSEGTTYADIHVVSGMNGTIIANVYVPTNQAITMITYDSGAEWSLIPSSNNQCYLPDCSLHFLLSLTALVNSLQTTLFSKSSAVGIILALGMESASIPIQTSSNKIGLYVSTDGGVSWKRTHSGSWLVTFADHAGVITAVKDYMSEQTTNLQYSLDEGANWYSYTFSRDEVTIGGLVTEPGEATLVDLLFAYDKTAASPDWQIVTVNYSKILSDPCQEKDYFYWSPYNARIGRDCLLGSSISWERKKPSSICYNGLDYERARNITLCKCSIADYECDWGYKHPQSTSESCVIDVDQKANPYAQSCTHGVSSYDITKGFRKIAGDVCYGGDTSLYDPTVVSCNNTIAIMFSSDDMEGKWAILGQKIVFNVTVTTSKLYDRFIWDFGEDGPNQVVTGNTVSHIFTRVGAHAVKVSTSDYLYTYSKSVGVVYKIQDAVFSHLYGAQAGAQTVFNSFLTSGAAVINSSSDSPKVFGYTHFSVWYNATGNIGNSDLLTQDFSFEHVFRNGGVYMMQVEVSGPVNTLTKTFPINVFDKVFVLELTFTQNFDLNLPVSPQQWIAQLQTAIMTKLTELNILSTDFSPEINIQPNSKLVYLSFNAKDSPLDFQGIQTKLESHAQTGTIGISIASYHGYVSSVREVTDLVQVEEGDYTGYAAAIVFLVLIVLTLAFLLVLTVVIIILIVRISKSANTHTIHGRNRNIYTGINTTDDDDEMQPLTVDSDDEHLLPLAGEESRPGDEVNDTPDN